MPSTLHEALVLLFRESPRLAPMLLARVLGIEVSPDGGIAGIADVQVTSAEFADLDPAEYRADVVLRVPDERDRDRATQEVFIVEVQLEPDDAKHFTWPQYVIGARTRYRCRATLVVVAVDERVALWCAQPIELDRAGNVFRPLVIGPGDIPVITDEAEARRSPELAVLSVIAHGREPGSEAIGAAALAACDRLDNPRSSLYADLIYLNLNQIARAALEAVMDLRNYEYQSDFARKYFAQGIAQGYREMLRDLLAHRFGALPASVGTRLEQADGATLKAWGNRALTAASLDDVFDSDPR
jgi:hypothetical protein